MDAAGPVLILCGFLAVFASCLYRELKRTPWDLLETLIMLVVVGNVVAAPIAYAMENRDLYASQGEGSMFGFAIGGCVCGLMMAGGAVWVFRRLNRLNERRRKVRLAYLALGLLLFPSIMAGVMVIGLPLALPVWIALNQLHNRTEYLPDPVDASPSTAPQNL
ncbi:MAG: hypothetical protein M5U26_24805 [Planctomycetota bacterium]|nr:hypothetical protein [Planctomycetota bacterium]